MCAITHGTIIAGLEVTSRHPYWTNFNKRFLLFIHPTWLPFLYLFNLKGMNETSNTYHKSQTKIYRQPSSKSISDPSTDNRTNKYASEVTGLNSSTKICTITQEIPLETNILSDIHIQTSCGIRRESRCSSE